MEEKRFKPGKTGEISAGPRIMRQLLRTPMFKDLAALSVDAKDPESARELARTLLWEDAAFSFGMLGGLPQDINILLAFLDEIGIQLHHVPPELLQQFVTEMAAKIDREALKALPETYAPLLKTLIWEDAERRQNIKTGGFEALNALMYMLADFLNAASMRREEMQELSPEGFHPDPQALAAGITSLFRWMGAAAGKDEASISAWQEKTTDVLQETMQTMDFGVIRDTLTRRAKTNYPVIESAIGTIVTDPVIFANVLTALPPVINNLLKGIAHGIAEIDFPPEILASAIFNLIDNLEVKEIGKLVNGLSRFINGLHEGSSVLGGDEPRFRAVFQNLVQEIVREIDETQIMDAFTALSEDLEIMIPVITDAILERPELLQKGAPVLISAFNALMQGSGYLVAKLGQLPEDFYQQIYLEWTKNLDFKETGLLVTAVIRLVNQVLVPHPDIIEKTLSSVYRTVDKKELGTLAQTMVAQSVAFLEKESIWDLLSPEEAGKMVNSILRAYNRNPRMYTENSQEALAIFAAQIDQQEVSDAILNTSNQISVALSANPPLSKSIMKSLYALVRGLIKGTLRKNSGKKVKGGTVSGGHST
ncbi:MAG: hypothetical protein GX364_01445 [Firmicutes bacterium]|nr:hypothetical protein [Bacillota bacterium]